MSYTQQQAKLNSIISKIVQTKDVDSNILNGFKTITDLDAPIDDLGNTALHLALFAENYECVQKLLEHGVSPNLCNDDGYTVFKLITLCIKEFDNDGFVIIDTELQQLQNLLDTINDEPVISVESEATMNYVEELVNWFENMFDSYREFDDVYITELLRLYNNSTQENIILSGECDRLEKTIDEYNELCIEVIEERDYYQAKFVELETMYKNLSIGYDIMYGQYIKSLKENDNQEFTINQLTEELIVSNENNLLIIDELDGTSVELVTKNKIIDELRLTKDVMLIENLELKNENGQYVETIRHYRDNADERYDQLIEDYNDLVNHSSEHEAELFGNIQKLMEENTELEIDNVNLSEEILEFKRELAIIQLDNQQLMADKNSMAEEIEEYESEADNMEDVLFDNSTKIVELTNNNLTLDRKLMEAEEEIATTKYQLIELNDSLEVTAQAYTKLKSLYKNYEDDIILVTEANDKLTEKCQDMAVVINDLRSVNNKLSKDNLSKVTELETVTLEHDHLHEKYNNLCDALIELKKELDTLGDFTGITEDFYKLRSAIIELIPYVKSEFTIDQLIKGIADFVYDSSVNVKALDICKTNISVIRQSYNKLAENSRNMQSKIDSKNIQILQHQEELADMNEHVNSLSSRNTNLKYELSNLYKILHEETGIVYNV